jgi:hypothetical protein
MNVSLNTIVALVALMFALPAAAQAQGVVVYGKSSSRTYTMLSQPTLIADGVQAVNDRRPEIEAELKKILGRGDMIAKGVTLKNINPRLGEAQFRFVSSNGFEVSIPGNYLYFASTQPTALGSWADPAFETHFDVVISGVFSGPTKSRPSIVIHSAQARVTRLHIKARNVASKVALTAANVVDYFEKQFTGKGLIESAFNRYARIDITDHLNGQLGAVNRTIKQSVDKGFTPSMRLNGQLLEVTLEAPPVKLEDLLKDKVRADTVRKSPVGTPTSKFGDSSRILTPSTRILQSR